ncbi:hypothetical protein AIIMSE5_003 [Acinetobacter phage AIIMS-AbE5-RC]|uniref:Uncharacterized protein n=1 Tax=Acinetobacter phage AIIMS-AbE5-RC TaxID=2981552 RepID=A0A9X9JSL0_9CAUD|nr:hypothetical protein AIIMSE5_003 [Acinetobacter phage AIIMS-AbE5-RC]
MDVSIKVVSANAGLSEEAFGAAIKNAVQYVNADLIDVAAILGSKPLVNVATSIKSPLSFATAGVFNVQSNAGIIILSGTLGFVQTTPVGGYALFTSGTNLYITVRESADVLNSKVIGAIDPAKPFYVAMSYDNLTWVITFNRSDIIFNDTQCFVTCFNI